MVALYGLPLFNIQFGWDIQLVGNILTVLLSLSDAFRQKIFDLPVDGTEVVLCPCGNCIIELSRKAKGNLFFVVCHGPAPFKVLLL